VTVCVCVKCPSAGSSIMNREVESASVTVLCVKCLSAGSSIMNREVESASMRPLAKTLTRHLDSLRSLLREQCFHNQYKFTDKVLPSSSYYYYYYYYAVVADISTTSRISEMCDFHHLFVSVRPTTQL